MTLGRPIAIVLGLSGLPCLQACTNAGTTPTAERNVPLSAAPAPPAPPIPTPTVVQSNTPPSLPPSSPISGAASAGPSDRDDAGADAANGDAKRGAARVKVENIGMHIGGGPNDAVTKAPIKASVDPHLDEFGQCFAAQEDPTKGGDFGIDLLIPAAGGKAKLSHPRTAIPGKPFEECVLRVFEAIEFQKPRKGLTMVSYSLRFTPTP